MIRFASQRVGDLEADRETRAARSRGQSMHYIGLVVEGIRLGEAPIMKMAIREMAFVAGLLTTPGIGSVAVSQTLGGNNVWTGINQFQNDTSFGGRPWLDVTSGAHGCGVLDGSGMNAGPNTTALNCYITWLETNYNGGVIYFPPGNYHVNGTIIIGATSGRNFGTRLVGAGPQSTSITGEGDINVLDFKSAANYASIEGLSVVGYQNATATRYVVSVEQNALVNMRDCQIIGGGWALNNSGTDGEIENCYIYGSGTSGGDLLSNGANWYIRDKFDANSSVKYAYLQGAAPSGATSLENHFVLCDFSGPYVNSSIDINDGGASPRALTYFDGAVVSSPIRIGSAQWTGFTGTEFGSTTLYSAGGLTVASSVATGSSITVTGAGQRSCSANIGITC